MAKSVLILAGISALVLICLAGCKATRAGYESPDYRVVSTDGKVQIRDYPSLVVAETRSERGMDGGFGRLFRFITGSNSREQKVAMTTPVLVTEAGSNSTMSFVMPNKYDLADLPKPNEEAVSLRTIEAGRFCVLRFSGSREGKTPVEAQQMLRDWMNVQGLQPISNPHYAYYDPPWVPGFLRRNEVMVRVAAE